METYSLEIERQMRKYYQSLCEKDRRRYAAIEAVKLGYGGIIYISKLFRCNYRTIALGIEELNDEGTMSSRRIRRCGGGRKRALATIEGINEAFVSVIQEHTAGSPMDEAVKWTNLTRQQIADLLQGQSINVSVTVVDQLLEKHKFRKRKAIKTLATGSSEQRNEQFENIESLKEEYFAAGNPVVSMDSKKKS
jgi:transcriptional regulator NrdR family protein